MRKLRIILDAITEFRVLFDTIAGLSMDPLQISPQNIVEHFCSVGLIRAHDGNQHDFARTLAKFTKKFDAKGKLMRPGYYNEEEFVKFWFNTHKFYNKYDVSKSTLFHVSKNLIFIFRQLRSDNPS